MTVPDTTLVRLSRPPGATRTLVCLGFCGGGTGPFHPWAAELPADTGLVAVCYPGREGRFAEDHATDWPELVADTARAVAAVAAEGRYVLVGHSMGGWMALEVAAALAAQGAPAPEAVTVSSCNAPDGPLTERDRFPSQAQQDDQLLDWMRSNGLLPAHVLADEDLTDMAVELMRADLRVRDSYVPGTGLRLAVPVQLLTGAQDEVIAPTAGADWAALTSGPFRHDVLPGGHFYTPEVWRTLPRHIAALSA